MTRFLNDDSGIEKTLTEVTAPKSTESTNSTTSAFGEYFTMWDAESQTFLGICGIDPGPKLCYSV